MSDDEETPLQAIVAGVTTGLILTVAFGLLALGVPWFWIVFPIGFAGVLPVAMGLVALYERRQARERDVAARESAVPDDPLTLLRDRYARGELGDAEFERKLDRLLETESPEDVDRLRRNVRESRDERAASERDFDLDTE